MAYTHMRFRKDPAQQADRAPGTVRWRRRRWNCAIAVLAIVLTATSAAQTGATPTGDIATYAPGSYSELMVPSAMGPIKVQVRWATRGGSAALYLLDGMRARDDRNAWSFETNAVQLFENDDVTLVMPVGGQSSFYTDWRAPSNTNGQKTTYKWDTFLTIELPTFLSAHGVSPRNNAIVGLSMGGSAALTLAAYHRDQFVFAGSFSGALDLTAPGMREAIRIAMLDAGGYNVDAMALPWSPQWLRMDPYVFAPQLRGLSMYISAASGLPGRFDHPSSAIGAFNTTTAMGLEALCLVTTRAFQMRLNTLGIPAHYDFPGTGTHGWKYWEAQLANARPQILHALNTE